MSYVSAIRNFSPGNVKLVTGYTFLPSSKLIVISEGIQFTTEQVLLIVNATAGKVIQDIYNASMSCTVRGKNIELNYDTTSMNADDNIVIYMAIDEQNREIEELNRQMKLLNDKFDQMLDNYKIILE